MDYYATAKNVPFSLYLLSQLEDVAVSPTQHNPSLNKVECVVESSSTNRFLDVKKAFPHICWFFWIFSLIAGYCINVLCLHFVKDNNDKDDNNKDVVKATLLFLFVLFLFGLFVAFISLSYSTKTRQMTYPFVFCVSIILLCFVGFICCKSYLGLTFNFRDGCNISFSEDILSDSTKYRPFVCTVYPGLFIGIHHFLWTMIGITTEPFWAIPVATSVVAVALLVYLLAFYCVSSERTWDALDIFHLVVLVCAVLSIVAVLFSFFLAGNQFFDNNLMSSTIPGILIVILSVWWKFYKDKESSSSTSNKNFRPVSQNVTSPQQ